MAERKMDRPLETLFDILTTEQRIACVPDKDTPHEKGFLENSVNGVLFTKMCEEQQVLTLHRVAHWLRGNAKIFQCETIKGDDAIWLDWITAVAKELNNLADDLDYLSDVHTEIRGDINADNSPKR